MPMPYPNYRQGIPLGNGYYSPAESLAYSMPVAYANPPARFGRDALRFGFSPVKGLSLLSKFGDLVDNSLYGRILVIDASLTGGRMHVAWPRSRFESFEYLFRDAISAIFYLATVPWVMKLGSAMLKTPWMGDFLKGFTGRKVDAHVMLDNQATMKINQSLLKHFEREGVTHVTPASLKEMLHGRLPQGMTGHQLFTARTKLARELRQAGTQDFLKLMEMELKAFANTPQELKRMSHLMALTRKQIAQRMKVGETFTAEQLEKLLGSIWHGKGTFTAARALNESSKFHLSTAAKLAFQHQAGLSGVGLKQALANVAGGKLDARFIHHLEGASRSGGDQLLASMLRRSFNAAMGSNSLDHVTAQHFESVLRCVEQAVIEDVPVQQYVRDKLGAVATGFREYLASGTHRGMLSYEKSYQLHTAISRLEKMLKQDTALDPKFMAKLANLLETNGRTLPKTLRWLQGAGLGHLAEDVKQVIPLLDGKTRLSELMDYRIQGMMKQLLKRNTSNPSHTALLGHYEQQIQRLLKGEGRVSLMLTESMAKNKTAFTQTLTERLDAILKGGLRHNQRLYNLALRVIQSRPLQAEAFFNPEEFERAKGLVDPYLRQIEHGLAKLGGNRPVSLKRFSDKVLKPITRLNAHWRYGMQGLALGVSIAGLTYLITKAQYWITKILTGKDEHPGIAAQADRLGAQPLHHAR